MSLSSRNFELHHPWLFIFGSVCGFVLLLGLMCLPVWGWIELRFSLLQRHYLAEYLQSSVGVVAGSGPEYVEWIKKKGPDGRWETAEPGDVVPTEQAYPPFKLSPAALMHGWIDLGYNTDGTFEQRDIRDTLQAQVFGGHSLLYFVLQPFELFFVGWVCWMSFGRWREQQARQRGAKWGAGPQFGPWEEDLKLFLKQIAQETGRAAVQTWKWADAKRQSLPQPVEVTVAGATVSPSGVVSTTPVPRPAAIAPTAVKVAEATPAARPKPTVPTAKPSPAATLKPQQSAPQTVTKPVPSSPFGKPAATGEPANKWDISQWID